MWKHYYYIQYIVSINILVCVVKGTRLPKTFTCLFDDRSFDDVSNLGIQKMSLNWFLQIFVEMPSFPYVPKPFNLYKICRCEKKSNIVRQSPIIRNIVLPSIVTHKNNNNFTHHEQNPINFKASLTASQQCSSCLLFQDHCYTVLSRNKRNTSGIVLVHPL